MDLSEGGIRVPWIAHWPAVIAPGGVSAQTCMTMDWSVTLLDGTSLLPLLRDASLIDERGLFLRMKHRGQRAMRQGAWKYLRVDGIDYLFNLAQDKRECAN